MNGQLGWIVDCSDVFAVVLPRVRFYRSQCLRPFVPMTYKVCTYVLGPLVNLVFGRMFLSRPVCPFALLFGIADSRQIAFLYTLSGSIGHVGQCDYLEI